MIMGIEAVHLPGFANFYSKFKRLRVNGKKLVHFIQECLHELMQLDRSNLLFKQMRGQVCTEVVINLNSVVDSVLEGCS